MALVQLNRPFAWPGLVFNAPATPAVASAALLNGAGEYDAIILTAKEDMAITHVGFRINAASGGVPNYRIETVDSSGLPSGTLWATNTEVTAPSAPGTGLSVYALTATANISRGQVFCVKGSYSSGTSLNFTTIAGILSVVQQPYRVSNTGTPTKSTFNCWGAVLGSSSTQFYCIDQFLPVTSIANGTITNTNGRADGARFQVPFKCRVIGMRRFNGSAIGDYNVLLQDDSNNELGSTSTAQDGDYTGGTTAGERVHFFDNAITLSTGTWYRLCVEPTSGTTVGFGDFSIPNTNYLSACPGGANFYYTTRSSGIWTDTQTRVPLIDLLIDQIDDGAGGSSGGGPLIGGRLVA